MSPELKEIFSGDAFYLNCNNGGSRVKWYFNDIEKHGVNETWKIAVAFPTHSGSYRCESNGEKSDNFNIEVNGKYCTGSSVLHFKSSKMWSDTLSIDIILEIVYLSLRLSPQSFTHRWDWSSRDAGRTFGSPAASQRRWSGGMDVPCLQGVNKAEEESEAWAEE